MHNHNNRFHIGRRILSLSSCIRELTKKVKREEQLEVRPGTITHLLPRQMEILGRRIQLKQLLMEQQLEEILQGAASHKRKRTKMRSSLRRTLALLPQAQSPLQST